MCIRIYATYEFNVGCNAVVNCLSKFDRYFIIVSGPVCRYEPYNLSATCVISGVPDTCTHIPVTEVGDWPNVKRSFVQDGCSNRMVPLFHGSMLFGYLWGYARDAPFGYPGFLD